MSNIMDVYCTNIQAQHYPLLDIKLSLLFDEIDPEEVGNYYKCPANKTILNKFGVLIEEIDSSPGGYVTKLKISNDALSISGNEATLSIGAGVPEVEDEAFTSGNFDGDTTHAVSQDDFYDRFHIFDADDDGDFSDEGWFPAAVVADEVFSAGNFDGDTTVGTSQDDFYDRFHLFDTDDDGSFADESWLTTYLTSAELTTTLGTAYDTEAELTALFAGKEDSDSNDIDPDRLAGDTMDDNVIDAGLIPDLSGTYELNNSNDIDPDRLAGDATDDNLIDEGIIDSDVARDSELIGSNEVYGSGWNGDTGLPEKDDIYDYLHQMDADDDGSLTDESYWPDTLPTFSMVVRDPSDSDSFLFAKLPAGITITDIHCIVDPSDSSESVVINVQECDSSGDNCVTADATITCDNDGAEDDGSLTNGTFDAGDWLNLDIGTVTGTVTDLTVTIY